MYHSKNTDSYFYILGSIGFILHLTSLIEYNLIQIISGEEYIKVFDNEILRAGDLNNAAKKSNGILHELTKSRKMLGSLIDILKEKKIFDESLIKDLKKVSKLRGYYAHQFFKDDLYSRHLETDPLFYKDKLCEVVSFIHNVHQQIFEIEQKYRAVANKALRT